MILDHPTVKDLVDCLLTFNQDKKIIIDDPDTNWDIVKIHISEYNGRIEMTGQYNEMVNP